MPPGTRHAQWPARELEAWRLGCGGLGFGWDKLEDAGTDFPSAADLSIVEIEKSMKIYESKLRVVAVGGIDLEFERGEISGLLEPNRNRPD
jgi:hypothetical protein